MKIDVVLTFLTVAELGSFVAASEKLNLTQSTVSVRIRALEEALGVAVFQRDKTGAVLTPQGRHFLPYAQTIWRQWSQARQDAGVPARFAGVARLGAQFSLWDGILPRWLPRFRAACPDISVQTEVDDPDGLVAQLIAGMLDLAIMYAPRIRAGLTVEPLFTEKLIFCATGPADAEPGAGYVFVDWGPEFRQAHDAAFPELDAPAVRFSLGTLALQHLLANGGSGYFPERLVAPLLSEGRLHAGTAPYFERPVYAVYPAEDEPGWRAEALAALRAVTRA